MTPDNYDRLSAVGTANLIRVLITWPYADATDLYVWQQNNATLATENSVVGDFSVFPDPEHRWVDVEHAWGDGSEVTVYVQRQTPRTQTYRLGEGPLNPTALTAQFDKVARIIQEIISKVPLNEFNVVSSKVAYIFPVYNEITNIDNTTYVHMVTINSTTGEVKLVEANQQEVITGVSIDGDGNLVLEKKNLKFFGVAEAASSQVVTTPSVEVMSELILDGGEALIKTKRQLKVLGASDTYAGEVFAFTPVSAVYEVELDDNTLKRTSFGFNALVLDPDATDEEDIMEFEQKNITIDVGTSSSSSGSGSRKLIETKQSVLVGKVSGAVEANNDVWSMTKKAAYTALSTSLGESSNNITFTKTDLWVWDDGDDADDVIGLNKINVLVDFQVDDTKLQTKTREVTVWEIHGDSPSWDTEHTGTTC